MHSDFYRKASLSLITHHNISCMMRKKKTNKTNKQFILIPPTIVGGIFLLEEFL